MQVTEHVPHPAYVPRTLDLRELRDDLLRARDLYGRGSSEAHDAYQRLNQSSHMVGRPLDGLARQSTDETERFFAQTIAGPDGHVYWDGPRQFRRNDGKDRAPRIWWWDHTGNERGRNCSVTATCGDRSCINPEHCEAEDRAQRHRQYTEEQVIGRIQIVTQRLGRVPTTMEWRQKELPHLRTICARFGSWNAAVRAAGLTPAESGGISSTPAACIEGLRAARKYLGRWPERSELRASYGHRSLIAHLASLGKVRDTRTIEKHLGSWPDALRKAGKR